MRKKDRIIMWPAYFDSTKTRKEGRRIPKSLAVPSPKISEMKEAVEKLKQEYEIMSDSGHPKTPWLTNGVLSLTRKETKSQTIRKIAKELLKIRAHRR